MRPRPSCVLVAETAIPFENIEVGGIFETISGFLYMKTEEKVARRLKDGNLQFFGEQEYIDVVLEKSAIFNRMKENVFRVEFYD